MRKLLMLIVCLMIFVEGCTTRTEHGPCIGINGKENPAYMYEYSAWNIVVGVVFAEFIFPPVIVVLDGLKCPVAGPYTTKETK